MSVLGILVRYAWSLAIGIAAGATLVIAHVFDLHPEQYLAFAVLGMIEDPRILEALQWGSVGGVALVSAGVVHFVAPYFRGHPNSEASSGDGTSSIRMTVGESGPYFDTEGGVYDIRRTFNLKLENIDPSKPVSNCSVKILSVTPATDYEGPWPLNEGLSLAAGEHVFIPLVTYGEAREPDKYPSGDTFMTMGTADRRPCLDVGKKYTLTMRATAPETAFCEFQCRIWVDDSGRLRIEEA